jgi:hypothetical protein
MSPICREPLLPRFLEIPCGGFSLAKPDQVLQDLLEVPQGFYNRGGGGV